ncbi:MAG TPA: hypothetical protein DCP31_25105, partial [Cyanobacteria bacterium UBA8543]|nr:hypothetical protein [Cyanobacteria bacterium UBA8543]
MQLKRVPVAKESKKEVTKQPKVKRRIGSRSFDDGSKKRKGQPIEDLFQLATMVRIELEGRKIGGY